MKRISKYCQVLFWILWTEWHCAQFVQISLRKVVSCHRPSALRHPISLKLCGLVVAVQDRWWRRVCWQPVYNLSSCLLHTWSLSLWHAVCLSSTLWHSQWDANVWNEDASMMSWCSLVDGRLYWWNEGNAEHISLEQKTITVAFTNFYWSDQSILSLVVGANSGI